MTAGNNERASLVVEHLLKGACFDSLRIYSTSIDLEFSRRKDPDGVTEAWISSTGLLQVVAPAILTSDAAAVLCDKHAAATYVLSQLIGEEVSAVRICNDATLEVLLGDCVVGFSMDEVNAEQVWVVASESPDPNYNHAWRVTLDDGGRISVREPSCRK